ncbi:MAG: hypothetical protein ACRDQA_17460 [Nocardioidaceae bacterium]
MSEPVGSVADEAAKLMAAVQARVGGDGGGGGGGGAQRDADGHASHGEGSPECRYCPLCQLMRYARSTSPEVTEHLANAAVSMALAFKALVDDSKPTPDPPEQSAPVEKIDLTED